MLRRIFLSFVMICIVGGINNVSAADAVNSSNSRITYSIKDEKGKKYKIYIKAPKESYKKGDWDHCSWNCEWAGINEGDQLYKGDYRIYLQIGSKKPVYTQIQKKGYIYNKTRKMIYYIPSKFKGQPDLFGLAETASSNFESIVFYYVKGGKLAKFKKELYYTVRPHFIGKNKFEIASYNNDTGKWTITTYTFSPSKCTTTRIMDKYYSFSKGEAIIKKWKPSWKG